MLVYASADSVWSIGKKHRSPPSVFIARKSAMDSFMHLSAALVSPRICPRALSLNRVRGGSRWSHRQCERSWILRPGRIAGFFLSSMAPYSRAGTSLQMMRSYRYSDAIECICQVVSFPLNIDQMPIPSPLAPPSIPSAWYGHHNVRGYCFTLFSLGRNRKAAAQSRDTCGGKQTHLVDTHQSCQGRLPKPLRLSRIPCGLRALGWWDLRKVAYQAQDLVG